MKRGKIIRNFARKHKVVFFAFGAVGVLALLVVATLIFTFFYFENRVLPNTYFSYFTLGGKNRDEVEVLVGRAIDVYSDSKIKLSSEGVVREFSLSDLGVSLSSDETVNKIMNKTGDDFKITNLRRLFMRREIAPVYYINSNKLSAQISESYSEIEVQPVDANVKFVSGVFVASESTEGRMIDREKVIADLRTNLDLLFSDEIKVDFRVVQPKVSKEQAESVLTDFESLIGAQLNLNYGLDKWILSGNNLYDMVNVYSVDFTDSKFLKHRAGDQVGLGLNFNNVDEFLNTISTVLDKPARDATLQFSAGKVSEFTSAQDGQLLNREETKTLLFAEILKLSTDAGKNVASINLPVTVKKARIANAEINKLGIQELIGSGVSYFKGSIANRIFNIELGASFINGTLVPPGEVFSFVKLVGDVSAAQGFKQAYVIKSGRTVLDDGGGICQVSSTVFRAALNTGLPIVKRTAHAYRVSYYEQGGFKAGLDATIFSPSVDLQFKNDTGRHILVQTVFDRSNSRLQVDIYGTDDGRRVELSEPVVTNIVPAPEPKYEEDLSLPAGTVKQVDFAANGATSVFSRKVFKGNEMVIDESFKSVFRPWQAVYLVGKAG